MLCQATTSIARSISNNLSLQSKKDIIYCHTYLSLTLQNNTFLVKKYFSICRFCCIKQFRNNTALVTDLSETSNCKNPIGAIIQEMTPFSLGTCICFEAGSTW